MPNSCGRGIFRTRSTGKYYKCLLRNRGGLYISQKISPVRLPRSAVTTSLHQPCRFTSRLLGTLLSFSTQDVSGADLLRNRLKLCTSFPCNKGLEIAPLVSRSTVNCSDDCGCFPRINPSAEGVITSLYTIQSTAACALGG